MGRQVEDALVSVAREDGVQQAMNARIKHGWMEDVVVMPISVSTSATKK
jgi:hypothetical protein